MTHPLHPSAPGPASLSAAGCLAFTLLPLAGLLAALALHVADALPLAGQWDWVPAIGVSWAWRIDGLALLMLLLIFGVGLAVYVYAGGYMAGQGGLRRLYVLLTLFMLAMAGAVTADHLVPLFVCWELTSITSFLLVGFDHERPRARRAAQQALLITGTGGLALLAGCLLLWQVMGTARISTIVAALPAQPGSPALLAALLLIVTGCFAKSAQFPFHFWLPNAMAAPTPVSAYLHSATMVKLGIYLLARLDAGFGDWLLWQWLLQGVGSLTAAWGMVLALRERDLKRILAWSTVATLGTLVALLGVRGTGAAMAVAGLLLAHALYKAPLFFVAGNIDHGTGTRLIDKLGYLHRAMPWTAAAALLAGMSMAGFPLSFGHVVKDVIHAAKESSNTLMLAHVGNTVFSAVAVAVAGVAALRVFWHAPRGRCPRRAHEGGPALVLPPLVLGGLGLLFGLLPSLAQPLAAQAAQAIAPAYAAPLPRFTLLNPAALWSFAVTFALGAAVFYLWDALHRVVAWLITRLAGLGFAAWYEQSLRGIPRLAAGTAHTLQHGRLPGYLAQVTSFVCLAMGLLLIGYGPGLRWPAWQLPPPGAVGACLLIGAGAVLAALMRERLKMLLAAGLVGYGSAVLFVFTGAPDLALTQFSVETVLVVVFAAVLLLLRRLGRAYNLPEPGTRRGALLLATGIGTVLALLLLVAGAAPANTALPDFFGRHSLTAAQGRNVVNVILVDFRALDTLGEIAVVLLSLVAAWPLLHRRRWPAAGGAGLPRSVLVTVLATPLYWFILAASLWLLLRGHNAPGGGFIAGLVASTASVLWAIAHDSTAATARLPLRTPLALATTGLGLALLATGLAWLLGLPFLTHLRGALAGLPLSTVLLFDIGVYATVWGTVAGYALALLGASEELEEAP